MNGLSIPALGEMVRLLTEILQGPPELAVLRVNHPYSGSNKLHRELYSPSPGACSFGFCDLHRAKLPCARVLSYCLRGLCILRGSARPSFSSSRTSFTRLSAISEICSRPSVSGNISTKAPKSTIQRPFPDKLPNFCLCGYTLSAVYCSISDSPLLVAIEMVPSSETSIFAPISSTSDLITLPPGPAASESCRG